MDYIVLLEDGTEVPFDNYGYYARNEGSLTLLQPRVPGHEAVTTVAVKFK